MNADPTKPILTITIIILLVTAIFLILRQNIGEMMYTEVTTEEKGSPYRENTASHYVTLIHYWLSEFLIDQPLMYGSDDFCYGYIEQGLVSGLIKITLDWERKKAILFYAQHVRENGECTQITKTVRFDDDVKLVEFFNAIRNYELNIYKTGAECAQELANIAKYKEVMDNVALEDEPQRLITVFLLLSNAIIGQKDPDPYLATAFLHTLCILKQQYPDALEKFLEANQPKND